jgi:hypothetical protein
MMAINLSVSSEWLLICLIYLINLLNCYRLRNMTWQHSVLSYCTLLSWWLHYCGLIRLIFIFFVCIIGIFFITIFINAYIIIFWGLTLDFLFLFLTTLYLIDPVLPIFPFFLFFLILLDLFVCFHPRIKFFVCIKPRVKVDWVYPARGFALQLLPNMIKVCH